MPLMFLRIFPLIIFLIMTALSGTERAKRKRWANQFIKYGTKVRRKALSLPQGLSDWCVRVRVCVECQVLGVRGFKHSASVCRPPFCSRYCTFAAESLAGSLRIMCK